MGKKHVLGFIDAGGLYVGTCAGFYFAAQGYFWQVGEPGGGEYHWSQLLGRFPEVEGSITNIRDDSATPGPATKITSAPACLAASAIAIPCSPEL